jgi:hypothetical protein
LVARNVGVHTYDDRVLISVDDLVHPFEAVPPARPDDVVDLGSSWPEAAIDPPACAGHQEAGPAPWLSGAERVALAEHCRGHLLFPWAGELTADRVAALVDGNAEAITRVIFVGADHPCVHTGVFVDPATRIREIQAWTATAHFAKLAERTGELSAKLAERTGELSAKLAERTGELSAKLTGEFSAKLAERTGEPAYGSHPDGTAAPAFPIAR